MATDSSASCAGAYPQSRRTITHMRIRTLPKFETAVLWSASLLTVSSTAQSACHLQSLQGLRLYRRPRVLVPTAAPRKVRMLSLTEPGCCTEGRGRRMD
eukprot:6184020-Pleurochrysis_carterae.AAC.2